MTKFGNAWVLFVLSCTSYRLILKLKTNSNYLTTSIDDDSRIRVASYDNGRLSMVMELSILFTDEDAV